MAEHTTTDSMLHLLWCQGAVGYVWVGACSVLLLEGYLDLYWWCTMHPAHIIQGVHICFRQASGQCIEAGICNANQCIPSRLHVYSILTVDEFDWSVRRLIPRWVSSSGYSIDFPLRWGLMADLWWYFVLMIWHFVLVSLNMYHSLWASASLSRFCILWSHLEANTRSSAIMIVTHFTWPMEKLLWCSDLLLSKGVLLSCL